MSANLSNMTHGEPALAGMASLCTPISAAEAAEVIEAGAWLYRARIGDLKALLELIGSQCPGQVLNLVACQVGKANCIGLKVGNPLNFSAASEHDMAEGLGTAFEERVDFSGATLAYPSELRGHYKKGASFQRTRFDARVSFSASRFAAKTSFSRAHFLDDANFVLSVFAHGADFTGATFAKTAQFSGADFANEADFASATFKDSAVFLASRFHRAIFFGAMFGGMTQFVGAIVRDLLILEFSRVQSTLDLHVDAKRPISRGRGWLNLADVDLGPSGRILLPMELIGRHQWPVWFAHFLQRGPRRGSWAYRAGRRLRRFIQERAPSVYLIEGEDSDDPVRLRAAASQYNTLRDNFRALPSKEEEEDRSHYKYKDLTRRSYRGHQFWRFWDWAVMKWCLGYGIYTRRVLMTAIGLVVFFAIVYSLGYHFNPELIQGHDSEFNALYFSATTFSTVGFGEYVPRGWLRVPVSIEAMLGMVMLSVFTVSFARKLIR